MIIQIVVYGGRYEPATEQVSERANKSLTVEISWTYTVIHCRTTHFRSSGKCSLQSASQIWKHMKYLDSCCFVSCLLHISECDCGPENEKCDWLRYASVQTLCACYARIISFESFQYIYICSVGCEFLKAFNFGAMRLHCRSSKYWNTIRNIHFFDAQKPTVRTW